jgi:hypothetical protein
MSIYFRGEAVDSLTAIGEPALPAVASLIQWALAPRVIRGSVESPGLDRLFVDLAAIDVFQRMRVAGAVSQLGRGAFPAIAALLAAPDGERRKLGVAILSEKALPIAADLLKSDKCRERTLGFQMFQDMWPVADKDILLQLRNLGCTEMDVLALPASWAQ